MTTKIDGGRRKVTKAEWEVEAKELFGEDSMEWKFVCPACGYVQSTRDYKEAGAESSIVGVSCVGRFREDVRSAFNGEGEGPCTYAGYGLFRINPVLVVDEEGHEIQAFEFHKEQ